MMGCDSLPQTKLTSERIATAHIAVLSVKPWSNVAESLQPTFRLSAEQALKTAIATTQASDDKLIDKTRFALALEANKSIFGDDTDPSTESKLPLDHLKTSPTRSALPGDLGTNPMLAYWAATALYQEVNLINRYVKDAAIADGYEPYLVRLQISVMPSRRDAPYDVYSTLSFYGEKVDTQALAKALIVDENAPSRKFKTIAGDSNYRPVQAIPLVVTDSIEQARRASSDEQSQQMLLALGLAFQGIGVAADLETFQNRLAEVFGKQENALMTIARISNNTVRVRIGAPYQVQYGARQTNKPAKHLSMVPRTYNVSLVVLIDKKLAKRQLLDKEKKFVELLSEPIKATWGNYSGVRLIWTNEIVDAETGKVVPRRPDRKLIVGMHNAVFGWTFDAPYDKKWATYWNGKNKQAFTLDHEYYDPIPRDTRLKALGLTDAVPEWNPFMPLESDEVRDHCIELVKAVLVDDIGLFQSRLEQIMKDHGNNAHEQDPDWPQRVAAIWHELSSERVKTRAGTMRFEVPKVNEISIVKADNAPHAKRFKNLVLIDDGKSATITLNDVGSGLRSDQLHASLLIDESHRLETTSIVVIDDGQSTQLKFPSLKVYGLDKIVKKDSLSIDIRLHDYPSTPVDPKQTSEVNRETTISAIRYASPVKPAKVIQPLKLVFSPAKTVLVKAGKATVDGKIEANKAVKPAPAIAFIKEVSADNARIVQVFNVTTKKPITVTKGKGVYAIPTGNAFKIEFADVRIGAPIEFKLSLDKDGKQTVGDTITLTPVKLE